MDKNNSSRIQILVVICILNYVLVTGFTFLFCKWRKMKISLILIIVHLMDWLNVKFIFVKEKIWNPKFGKSWGKENPIIHRWRRRGRIRLLDILVCSGCHNRLPQTGGLNNNSFISELCKSKIKVPSELVCDEASLLIQQEATFLLCLHMAFALYPDRVLVSPLL